MPAELLTDFGAAMEPALEQGAISLAQAWELTWAVWVDEELTPQTHNLMCRVLTAAQEPAPQEVYLH